MPPLLDRNIHATPMVAIDVETTGLHRGTDRVVEIAVARVPRHHHQQPDVVFDTLVRPQRPLAATEIHRITEADLEGAPTFADVQDSLRAALAGAIVVSYNAYFDTRFLATEYQRLGRDFEPPFLCAMLLAKHAGLPAWLRLVEACRHTGIPYEESHTARDDAVATARLMAYHTRALAERGIERFRDLAAISASKSLQTLTRPLIDQATPSPTARPLKPRRAPITPWSGPCQGDYTAAVLEVISDYVITESEIAHLAALRDQLRLTPEQRRAAHATLFTWALTSVAADAWVDQRECDHLHRVHACLRELGWAPGDAVGN